MAGPQGDRSHFGEFIRRNVYLKELREQIPQTTSQIAHYSRNELHEALRSGPYQVNILLGGVDNGEPSLYYMDYLASMQQVTFGIHGHASNFGLSILDKYWRPDMDLEQGLDCLRKIVKELNTRFLISLTQWKVKVVTAEGVKEIALE
jgi:20S proteasome alpha/beta subunit